MAIKILTNLFRPKISKYQKFLDSLDYTLVCPKCSKDILVKEVFLKNCREFDENKFNRTSHARVNIMCECKEHLTWIYYGDPRALGQVLTNGMW